MIGWLTINRECNLKCEWCYAKDSKFSSKKEMNLDVAKGTIAIMKGLGIREVCITGGEPTISDNLFSIIGLVVKNGIVPMLVTNGVSLSDRKFLNDLLASGISGISLSIKAPNEKFYKEWTGVDAFRSVSLAIQNLTASGVKHSVSFTVTKKSVNMLEELINELGSLGVKYFNLDLGRPIMEGDFCSGDDIPIPPDLAKAVMKVYPLLKESKLRFVISLSIPFCLMPEEFIEKMVGDDTLLSGCQIHNGDGFIVDTDGNLLPCNHFCNKPLGKIGEDFSDADEYNNFRQREDVKKFYKYAANYPDIRCMDCRWWQKCGGGCFMRWLSSDANLLIPG